MTDRLIFGAMAALALGAVIAGLMLVGGPQQARLERENIELLQDLQAMAQRLRCKADDAVLPETYAPSDTTFICGTEQRILPELRRKRPEVPVIYHRDTDVSFRLCATFHEEGMPPVGNGLWRDFEPETGCLFGTIR